MPIKFSNRIVTALLDRAEKRIQSMPSGRTDKNAILTVLNRRDTPLIRYTASIASGSIERLTPVQRRAFGQALSTRLQVASEIINATALKHQLGSLFNIDEYKADLATALKNNPNYNRSVKTVKALIEEYGITKEGEALLGRAISTMVKKISENLVARRLKLLPRTIFEEDLI